MTRIIAAFSAAAILLVTLCVVRVVAETPKVASRLPLQQFPAQIGGWEGHTEFFDPAVIASLNVDDYLLRTYAGGPGAPLWLYVAYYGAQPPDSRVHSPAVCLPGAGWYIATAETIPIATVDGTIRVNRNVIQKGDDRQVVLYWYQIHGRVVAREMNAIAVLAWTSLTERATDEALVRVNEPITQSADQTTQQEVAFVQAAFPALRHVLPSPGIP